MEVGLKVFPACVSALESLDPHLDPHGRLLVLVVYEGSNAAARQAAGSLESAKKIRGHPLLVRVLSAADLDAYAGPRPGAIFIASIGLEPHRLRNWSERLQTLVFSPFADAVEEGAVAGIHVSDRIQPAVNLAQADRAGIRFKPYFLKEARYHEPFSEIDVRAVFLFNFALFIDWPSSAFDAPSAPLRYCVLGNPALSVSLKRTLADERVAGRPLQIADARNPDQWRRCHILYIDHRSGESLQKVVDAVKGAPVLTVGDTDTMAHEGGMISLIRKGERLHPVINREAAMRSGIQISSKLLRLATLVPDSPDGN
ncbi:PUTATIVE TRANSMEMBRANE PROTEIN [Imhoffiella purpurea]|uniref:PUTATIVE TRANSMEMBRANE PROTEIN n=2 Tax=Imhoffiella purpurea TaxID=1249627 RepID=W9VDB1_9GAMM|nr:PUTATIVE TRANSMEMBRANE PROTEIN [Imhoffiella purpurea]